MKNFTKYWEKWLTVLGITLRSSSTPSPGALSCPIFLFSGPPPPRCSNVLGLFSGATAVSEVLGVGCCRVALQRLPQNRFRASRGQFEPLKIWYIPNDASNAARCNLNESIRAFFV